MEVSSMRDKYIHNVFKDKDVLKAEWVDNPLTLACKYGYTLIYNEFRRGNKFRHFSSLSFPRRLASRRSGWESISIIIYIDPRLDRG